MEIFILYTMIIFMDHYINYHMTVSSRVSFSVTLIPSEESSLKTLLVIFKSHLVGHIWRSRVVSAKIKTGALASTEDRTYLELNPKMFNSTDLVLFLHTGSVFRTGLPIRMF